MKLSCLLSLLLLILLIASCSVETSVELNDDASGRAELLITLHPVAVRYMTDISQSFSGEEENPQGPFDLKAIEHSFQARQGVELESIETNDIDTLRISVRFDDVRELLEPSAHGEDGPPVSESDDHPLTLTAENGRKKLTLRLTRENFYRVSGLFIQADSPLTVLLPFAEGDFMPRDEYLEVLTYALEDYLDDTSVDEFVKDSGVQVRVTAESAVSGVEGGEIRNGTAVFFIPLVEVLTLENDIEYSLSW